jgi:hypothetical protein
MMIVSVNENGRSASISGTRIVKLVLTRIVIFKKRAGRFPIPFGKIGQEGGSLDHHAGREALRGRSEPSGWRSDARPMPALGAFRSSVVEAISLRKSAEPFAQRGSRGGAPNRRTARVSPGRRSRVNGQRNRLPLRHTEDDVPRTTLLAIAPDPFLVPLLIAMHNDQRRQQRIMLIEQQRIDARPPVNMIGRLVVVRMHAGLAHRRWNGGLLVHSFRPTFDRARECLATRC